MDCLTPSPCDFTSGRFRFNSGSIDSTSKLSVDTLSQMSPLELLKDHSSACTLLKSHQRKNNKVHSNQSTVSNHTGNAKRRNHSSGDSSANSSGGSSANSVFYKSKESGDYVKSPSKTANKKASSCLRANGSAKSNDTTSCMSLKSKLTSEEVSYTITDELDDSSNQVVFLPPPPTDFDSDNDSDGRCDVGGPCSPRHPDWRSSGDLSKSPISRGMSQSNSRCLCCMLLVFVLSTAGLASVVILMHLGKLQLAPIPNVNSYNDHNGGRLVDGSLVREICDTPTCLRTASSILSRMNMSASPCEDFYNYACGGYIQEVDLSWFKTRIRESPDEIIYEHRKFIIDRLSTSFEAHNDKLLASAKEIFRSCLFRSSSPDDRTRAVVTDIIETLGGMFVPSEVSDLTLLLANVTRMFGASPFFKVVVHSSKNLSLISKVNQFVDPWSSPRDFSRSRTSSKQTDGSGSQTRLSEILIQLIGASVNESESLNIVSEFLRLEAHIRRILNSGREATRDEETEEDEEILCDAQGNQKTMGELQMKYNGFGIDWITFFQNVIDNVEASEIKFCKVKLSLELQHLLKITSRTTLRHYIILHTLIYSDLSILFTNNFQSVIQSFNSAIVSETQEEQCLDLILHFLPSLEKFSGCDEETLFENSRNVFNTLRNIRSSLYDILLGSLRVSKENAAMVTNSSMKPVMASVSEELIPRCQSNVGPQGAFDEYSFNTNMLRIIQYHYGEYFRGRLSRVSKDLELTALWISTSVEGGHRARAGPIVYPSPVPQPVVYGSLGWFLASKLADGLGIENLLDHHAAGLLNHSVVLGLAVQLKCLAEMYGNMEILDYGVEVYKVDGEVTKGQQWKDQLTLQMSYQAWKQQDGNMNTDHFIPGLTFSRPQMFFIAFAQVLHE